jgi:hypothetical protein
MSSYPQLRDGKSSPQSLYEVVQTTPVHSIGTRAETEDGRVFHYGSHVSATAIGPNKVAQMCPPVATHVSESGAVTGLSVANSSDGPKTITALLGATAAYVNEYAGGLLKIQSAATTGGGQVFSIPGHAAAALSTALSFSTTDPVNVAVAGATVWTLVHNPWGSVVISPAVATAPAAGVVLVSWPAATTAAPNYGWIQTWGLASILNDTTNLVRGHGVVQSAAVAGSNGVAVHTTIPGRIGVSMATITTDSVYVSVFLQISP